MGYILWFGLLLAVAAAVIGAGFFLAVPILIGSGATGLVAGMAAFATSGVRGFGGEGSLDGLGIRPQEGGEPAYTSYFQGPVVREFGMVVRQSSSAVFDRISNWVAWTWDRFLQFDGWFWKSFVALPALAVTVGLIGGGVLAAAILLCVTLVAAVVLGTLVVLGLLLGLALRGVEFVVLAVRGITLECPSCRERVTRPVYRCSGEQGCDAEHRKLLPGRHGVLFRVCQCGRSLPTLLSMGKLKLLSQCSHCEFQLPLRGYSAPTLHIPVAGAPQVGKSVFMFSSVKRLYDGVGGDDTQQHFWADEGFMKTFVQMQESVRAPGGMLKTAITERVKAYNIYLGSGTQRRLLYLYDTAGEIYDDSGALSQADFYRVTKGIIFCIDPFSLAGLRRRVDRATLDDVRSLPQDPKVVLERLTENLREWRTRGKGGRQLAIKMAVVLTKADALHAAQVPHPYEGLAALDGKGSGRAERDAALRTWIADVGVRPDLVTSITNNFQTVSFFVASHRDAASNDRRPQRSVNDDPADPVQWILNRGGLA